MALELLDAWIIEARINLDGAKIELSKALLKEDLGDIAACRLYATYWKVYSDYLLELRTYLLNSKS